MRHIVVTLNKSSTLRFDASAVVGAPDIMDALPTSDRVLYIQGKKVGTTDVSQFDQSMKLIGVLDVEVAIRRTPQTDRERDDVRRGRVMLRLDKAARLECDRRRLSGRPRPGFVGA